MTHAEVVSRKLKTFRAKKGITQAVAATAAGIPEESWNRAEKGRLALKLDFLDKLATVLGMPVWKLLKPPPADRAASAPPAGG